MRHLHVLCIAGTALLIGCASAPKPVMPEDQVKVFAHYWVGTIRCGESGRIPAQLAAFGQAHFTNVLNSYSYVPQNITNSINALEGLVITDQKCNQLAVYLYSIKADINKKSDDAAYRANEYKSLIDSMPKTKNTYCNQIGTQTFCSTF